MTIKGKHLFAGVGINDLPFSTSKKVNEVREPDEAMEWGDD